MNNQERDAAIARLEARQAELLEARLASRDFSFKRELAAESLGIELALQEFDPRRKAK